MDAGKARILPLQWLKAIWRNKPLSFISKTRKANFVYETRWIQESLPISDKAR